MVIEDSFDVNAPVERVWSVLKDVPRVAPCIPNAKITEVVDDRTYRASVGVKVGPVSVSYKTTIVIESLDDAQHRATIKVTGSEAKGRGGVNATVVSTAQPRGDQTHVNLHTDASISGIVATVGGRLIEGVAKLVVAQFAKNLAAIV
jgi:carbon monoxide dehydrogenase subunit G